MKGLEEFLGRANAAQGLPEVDVEAVRRNLGDDAARHVVRLQKALQGLKDQGFVDRQGRQLHLTPKGVRQIGQQALRDLFAQLRDSPTLGMHRVASVVARGRPRGDLQALAAGRTVRAEPPETLRNAVLRQGPGTPVQVARRRLRGRGVRVDAALGDGLRHRPLALDGDAEQPRAGQEDGARPHLS